MANTVKGTLEINARGIELLDSINNKLEKLTHPSTTDKITAMSTAFMAIEHAISPVIHAVEHLGAAIVQKGIAVERSRATWLALLGTMDKVQTRMEYLDKYASKAPFELSNITDAAKILQSFDVYSKEAMEAIGNTAAIFNRDITDTAQALALAGEGNTRMLKMYGISSAEIMQKMGRDGFRMAIEGVEDFDKITKAVIDIMQEKFGKGMSMIMETTSGKLTNLKDLFAKAKKDMALSGVNEGINKGLSSAIELLEKLYKDGTFKRIGEQLGGMLNEALNKIMPFIQGGATGLDVFAKARAKYPEKNLGLMNLGSEAFFNPTLSAIPEVRTAAGLYFDYHEKQFGKGSFMPDWTKTVPAEYVPYVQQAASMLLDGEDKALVSAWMASAITQRALSAGNRIPPAKAGKFTGLPAPEVADARAAAAGLTDKDVQDLYESIYGKGKGKLPGLATKTEYYKRYGLDMERQVPFLKGQGVSIPFLSEAAAMNPSLLGDPEAIANTIGAAGSGAQGMENALQRAISDPYLNTMQNLIDITEMAMDTVAEKYAGMGKNAEITFRAISRFGGAAYEGLTKYVELQLLRQGKAHIKLKDVAEYAVREGVSSFLEGEAKKAAAEALMYGALALGHLATGNIALSADAAGAAAAYMAAAAAMGGTAAAVRSGGAGHWGSATGHQYTSYDPGEPEKLGGGSRGASASVVGAMAGPQSITYSVNVSYFGPVIFGEGGSREWYRSQLLPLIQESRQNGELQ